MFFQAICRLAGPVNPPVKTLPIFHTLNPEWVAWAQWVTLPWLVGLVGHGVYVFAIADYSPAPLSPVSDTGHEGDSKP